MTPPDRPLPLQSRPDNDTDSPGGDTGCDTGGDTAGELLWWALRAMNVHDLVVFPVRSGGKTPAVRGWQHVATQDRAQLRRWFRAQRWNVGIATGPSRLLVIDLDDGHGHAPPPRWRSARHGRDVFTRLAAEAGEPDPGHLHRGHPVRVRAAPVFPPARAAAAAAQHAGQAGLVHRHPRRRGIRGRGRLAPI